MMGNLNEIWHTVNRNAAGILVVLTLVGAVVGTPVGVAIWIVDEMNDLKAELRAEFKAELQASERRQAEALRASEERQLAAIAALLDDAVRKATEESREEFTDLLGRHSHSGAGQVVISVAPDGQGGPAPSQ